MGKISNVSIWVFLKIKVEVVIRPEDISLIKAEEGLFKATVDSMLFRGVHYEICCIDNKGYEWVIQTTKKLK